MNLKQLKHHLSNKSYLEVYLISGNRIIDILYEADIGQRWLISRKTNKAFIIPDRSEGLLYKQKTIFFYSNENATPLALEDRLNISDIDTDYLYGINSENKFIRLKNRILKNPNNLTNPTKRTTKIKPVKITGTTIEPSILKSIINTKIVEDLLKPNESPWEQLKIPIIIGIIAITVIVLILTM